MALGPFDPRRTKSRCFECSRSHLKCSGDLPCKPCSRRRILCSYPPKHKQEYLILLQQHSADGSAAEPRAKPQRRRPASPTSTANRRSLVGSSDDSLSPTPQPHLPDETLRYVNFFNAFSDRNIFTGRSSSSISKLREQPSFHSRKNRHLWNAVLALGAIYATNYERPGSPLRRQHLISAMQYYSISVTELRESINTQATRGKERGPADARKHGQVGILWTSLLLGLFELMIDPAGSKWTHHIVEGLSKALRAIGPSAFSHGPELAFFQQARIFEVCRSILFNDVTFLVEPDWALLTRSIWARADKETWHPLESLLDIMPLCSALRQRASNLLYGENTTSASNRMLEATKIAADGQTAREVLDRWSAAYRLPAGSCQDDASNCASTQRYLLAMDQDREANLCDDYADGDAGMLLARVFFAAISIYLSGVFDYELSHWRQLGVVVPIISADVIQSHADEIIRLTNTGLSKTNLSPIMFLFPLRIAGARSFTETQRLAVLHLIAMAGRTFAAASAISADLVNVWRKSNMAVPASGAEIDLVLLKH